MPFVVLPNSDISLFWRSNIPKDDLSTLASSSKPLLLILQPLFLSIDFLDPQFDDPLLSNSFNLIAFDGITYGRSNCPSYISAGRAAEHDTWVESAIIALCAHTLKLPPFHIMAIQNNSINAALRFSILFPNNCLSLTLCGVAGPVDVDWVSAAYSEIMQAWLDSNDLEAFEEAINGLAYFMFNEKRISDDELDQVVEHWQKNYNPSRCTRILGVGTVVMTRVPLQEEEFALVHCPVKVVQGDSSEVHPVQFARDLQKKLVNVPGGATLEIVVNGPECLTVPVRFANIVNKHVAAFLFSLPACPSSVVSSAPDRCVSTTDLHRALALLAELGKNPDLNQLPPTSAWSFSRVPETVKTLINNIIPPWVNIEKSGITHLGSDGKPLRRFSERHNASLFSPRENTPTSSRPGSSAGKAPIAVWSVTTGVSTALSD